MPKALGLTTREWVEQRLGGYVRLSVQERQEAVAELTEDGGLPGREAAAVLGIDERTVRRDKGDDAANAALERVDQREAAANAAAPPEPETPPSVAAVVTALVLVRTVLS